MKHTKLDYDECCAKLILEDLFPARYHDLIVADKPDLQGKDVGIEVTIANEEKAQEALSNWIKANKCTDEKERKRYIERMAQLGVKHTGGIQTWPGFCPTFRLTYEAIKKKVAKLKNGNYKFFPQYELFVFTDTWYDEIIIIDAKESLFTNEISDYYKTIYVLSMGTDLHIFETDRKEYSIITIDISEQSNRNIRAWHMVKEAEDG